MALRLMLNPLENVVWSPVLCPTKNSILGTCERAGAVQNITTSRILNLMSQTVTAFFCLIVNFIVIRRVSRNS